MGARPAFGRGRQLLNSAPEAAAKLKSRLFSEPYAIHWAAQKAQ